MLEKELKDKVIKAASNREYPFTFHEWVTIRRCYQDTFNATFDMHCAPCAASAIEKLSKTL